VRPHTRYPGEMQDTLKAETKCRKQGAENIRKIGFGNDPGSRQNDLQTQTAKCALESKLDVLGVSRQIPDCEIDSSRQNYT